MRYYSTQRPVGPRTFPRQGGTETVTNFDGKIYCKDIRQFISGVAEKMALNGGFNNAD